MMNRREFAERFEAVHQRLWLVAVGSIGDRTEADDIVQEAAIIAYRKLDGFRPGTNFAAWLSQIVRHCAANYKRKVTGRRTFAADPGSLDQVAETPIVTSPAQVLDGRVDERLDLDDEMLNALQQLSPIARCCLLLRVVQDAPYSEISRMLDIPEGTAMSHVHRSKQQLRARLAAHRDARGGGRS